MISFNKAYRTILESYSPHKTDSLVRRLQSIDPEAKDIDINVLKDAYDKFHRIILQPNFDKVTAQMFPQGAVPSIEKRRDPSTYTTYKDLEALLFSFPDTSKEVLKRATKLKIDPIYEDDQIRIFQPKSQDEMIYLGKNLQMQQNCMFKTDAGNMYNGYRYWTDNVDTPPTFYIVEDKSDSKNDISVMAYIYGNLTYKIAVNKHYVHHDENVPWDKVVEIQPKLKGLQHVFKIIPYSQSEEKYINEINRLSEIDFDKLTDSQKSMLINSHLIHILTINQYVQLSKELKRAYLNRYDFTISGDDGNGYNKQYEFPFKGLQLMPECNNIAIAIKIFDIINDPVGKSTFLARYRKYRDEYTIPVWEKGEEMNWLPKVQEFKDLANIVGYDILGGRDGKCKQAIVAEEEMWAQRRRDR